VKAPARSPAVGSGRSNRALRAADATRHWQVAIVGGGPAAAACGIAAATRGIDVLLIERSRMPRRKLCGCCLSRRAMAELSALGLRQDGLGGVPLTRVRLATAGHTTTLPMTGGMTLSRERLDATLLGLAVERGCHLLSETAVQSVTSSVQAARLTCRVGGSVASSNMCDARHEVSAPGATVELTADAVVLATGLTESVRIEHASGEHAGSSAGREVATANRIGVGTTLPPGESDLPPGELVMAVGEQGYCGLVRLEDGRLDIAAAVAPEAVAGRAPAAAVQAILASAGLAELPLATAKLRGTPLLTHRHGCAEGRLFRTGDAAGYVEPFTGEGIGWALTSGRLLGEALAASFTGARLNQHVAASYYTRCYEAELGSSLRRCRLVSRAIRSPRRVRWLIGAARLAPWAGGPLVRLATGGGWRPRVSPKPRPATRATQP